MGNPYRKLFNLFAFSLLAFAIYLNFFHKDTDDNSVVTNTNPTYNQAAASQPKQPVALENAQPSAKEEKKN
jgi:hypothetical protein